MEEERLDVGRRKPGPAAPEEVAVQLLEARQRGRNRLRRRVDDRREHVVVQVAPDAREIGDDVDPEAGELVRGADAGEQQQLGRLDRACADDDLALRADLLERTVPGDLDPDAARALEEQALCAAPRSARSGRASRRAAPGRPSRRSGAGRP